MKSIVLICLLALSISLSALTETVMPFTTLQPSTITRAMGYGYAGVADAWHVSPLIASENPALPALHEGIAFGFTDNQRTETEYFDKDRYTSSMITLSYHGIALTLPWINSSGRFGTYGNYVSSPQTYEIKSNDHGYYTSQQYGLSVDIYRYLKKAMPQCTKCNGNLDILAGMSYNALSEYMSYEPYSYAKTAVIEEQTHAINAGLLMKYTTTLGNNWNIEGSFGYQKFNIGSQEVTYSDNSKLPLGNNDIIGAGALVSIPTSNVMPEAVFLNQWSKNFITGMVLASSNFAGKYNIDEFTNGGLELGFLDTVYLRGGYYGMQRSDQKGFTRGIGLKLHYYDIATFECNYAKYPEEEYKPEEQSWDFMLSFDALKITNAFKH